MLRTVPFRNLATNLRVTILCHDESINSLAQRLPYGILHQVSNNHDLSRNQTDTMEQLEGNTMHSDELFDVRSGVAENSLQTMVLAFCRERSVTAAETFSPSCAANPQTRSRIESCDLSPLQQGMLAKRRAQDRRDS